MRCKICGTESNKYRKSEGVDVLKCPKCRFVFYSWLPKSYDKLYVEKERGEYYKNLKKEQYFKFILKPYIKKGIKFLDVGCAAGLSVKIARDLGADAYGIDLDPDLIEWGKKRFNLGSLYCVNIENFHFKKNFFDIVFMNQTIEHVYELNKMMLSLKKIVKKNGKVIVICPNFGRIIKKEKIGGDHVNYFINSNMIKLFKKYGFKLIRNPKCSRFVYNLYYGLNYILKNKLNFFQIWLTFKK